MPELPDAFDPEQCAQYLRALGASGSPVLPIAEAALALASFERPRVALARYRQHLVTLARDVGRHPSAEGDRRSRDRAGARALCAGRRSRRAAAAAEQSEIAAAAGRPARAGAARGRDDADARPRPRGIVARGRSAEWASRQYASLGRCARAVRDPRARRHRPSPGGGDAAAVQDQAELTGCVLLPLWRRAAAGSSDRLWRPMTASRNLRSPRWSSVFTARRVATR